ncbi:ankyrin repeat domain-containing protein [Polymorphobacter fuscus]|uniref:Ankyrin repeat domain-containing protein n=2 Tax=Sandarakinorhabdus fusca TaxID=1439888 RepID=A0A7C9KI09_9SPHN|nr:ankyrin repeat domain-containing protein [Polymorphobacter fuscus]MQT16879.1 ankyrin repeat domain-containing protein [Polymorphobacter fuscus]
MIAALVGLAAAQPAAAQFSDAYNFLKAVRDKDGGKATQFLDKPGNTIVNIRDNDTGDTALHIVTRRSDLPWMGFMIGKGANVNAKDGEGSTPLIIAAISRFSEGIDLLLKAKAQPDVQNRLGETALLKAVQNRDTTSAKLLIDAGANPDIADSSGISARSAATGDPRAAAIARMLKDVAVRTNRPVQGPTR